MQPAHILVIEDDTIVARTIERSLGALPAAGDSKSGGHKPPEQRFNVTVVNRGDKGLRAAQQLNPDLIILDIIMPDMDGYTVCRNLRADPKTVQIPILFLTAKVKPQDKIAGFLAGGDDYLCKPFNVDELIMRVQAILRRTLRRTRPAQAPESEQAPSGAENTCLKVGEFILDARTFELHTPSRGKVRLTPLQFDLLYHMMTHPGEAFSPARLLDEIWDYPAGRGSPDLVRVHIKTLRERIEENPAEPAFLCTIPGQGYAVR